MPEGPISENQDTYLSEDNNEGLQFGLINH